MRDEVVTGDRRGLPDGWKVKALSELITIRKGKKQEPVFEKKMSGSIPHILVESFDGIYKKYTTNTKGKMCNKDDILIIWDGSRYGLIATNLEGYVGSTLGIISSKGEILTDFLYYFLKLNYNKIREQKKGSGIPHLDVKYLQSFKVIFPENLNEQQKIVDKLDKQMAQIEMMKKEAKKQINCVNIGIESYLLQLFFNKIPLKSSKSLKSSDAPEGWKWVKLLDIAKLESGHTPRKTEDSYWKGGTIPWISLQDIKNFNGDYTYDTIDHPTEEGINNSSARILPKDTVVLSRDASIGHVILMGNDMSTTQHFVNYICSDKIKPLFLLYLLRASKQELDRLKEGAIIKTLYMPLIKSFEIMLPPLKIQEEIIEKMKTIYKYHNFLLSNAETQRIAINQLPESILNEVFGQYQLPDET